jgi:hypothetical protein
MFFGARKKKEIKIKLLYCTLVRQWAKSKVWLSWRDLAPPCPEYPSRHADNHWLESWDVECGL